MGSDHLRKWLDLQQGSAPSHAAKTVQQWREDECSDFIPSSELSSSSLDLKPLDFSIWGYLEAKVNSRQRNSIESLKKQLIEEWRKIPKDLMCLAVGRGPNFYKRLCVNNKA